MVEILKNSRTIHRALFGLFTFLLGYVLIPTNVYIEILNGLFVGSIFTVVQMFRRVFWKALSNVEDYGRAEHFAVGILFYILTVIMGRTNYIWIRSSQPSDILDQISFFTTALTVATAIAGGLYVVTAPGWNSTYIHEHDKKTLYWSTAIGLLLALGVFMLQRWKLLLTTREYMEQLFT